MPLRNTSYSKTTAVVWWSSGLQNEEWRFSIEHEVPFPYQLHSDEIIRGDKNKTDSSTYDSLKLFSVFSSDGRDGFGRSWGNMEKGSVWWYTFRVNRIYSGHVCQASVFFCKLSSTIRGAKCARHKSIHFNEDNMGNELPAFCESHTRSFPKTPPTYQSKCFFLLRPSERFPQTSWSSNAYQKVKNRKKFWSILLIFLSFSCGSTFIKIPVFFLMISSL